MTALALLQRHRWRLLITLPVLALALVQALNWWRGPELATVAVVRGELIQSVVASGHVETPHRVDIGAQITATVARVAVGEGETVSAGAILLELDNREARANLQQATMAVAQASARLRQLREVQAPVATQTLRQALTNLDNARSVQRRNQDLHRQGFISAAALENADKAVALAEAQYQSARQQLDGLQANGSELAQASAALAVAEAARMAAQARLDYTLLRAPLAGTILSRRVEAGDVVQAGKTLLTLSPTGKTQLVVDIDEKNLRLLREGQPAQASADAYPQERFAAVLGRINPAVNRQTGAVEVRLDVPQPPATLRQDMTVSVDIEVARRSNALLLPLAAVHLADAADGGHWVLRIEAGRAQRRAVRLGLIGSAHAEVLDGLAAGDVVLADAQAASPGQRVRPLR
ncbi:efflux RND transporter periplasmic adaptor subunit [Chitinilyticum litopenaei]|uniref:efflux RND transporter periplasmic adaptor subunit n=1 Tax=Chitinilyticum litopenaei TaxID=1121276 RepID=UPI000406FD7C|nr:efflux RND transporter periplasmic adaptor subunit [Chitinilyticum litopenaei]